MDVFCDSCFRGYGSADPVSYTHLDVYKRQVVLSVTYEHSGILARILDERGEFPVPPVAETLEDAYVYCMGGKNYE